MSMNGSNYELAVQSQTLEGCLNDATNEEAEPLLTSLILDQPVYMTLTDACTGH